MFEANCVILGGGKSQRMGQNKALLPIGKTTIIDLLIDELAPLFQIVYLSGISSHMVSPAIYQNREHPTEKIQFIVDHTPDCGPLMGISSVLQVSSQQINFIMACDIPVIDHGIIESLYREAILPGVDIVLPKFKIEQKPPLYGFFHRGITEPIHELLKSDNNNSLFNLFKMVSVSHVPQKHRESLPNLNTMSDYREFQATHLSERDKNPKIS